MMSLGETLGSRRHSPCSLNWTLSEDDGNAGGGGDGVPRIYTHQNVHTMHGCAIGHGGDHGSLVYSLGKELDFLLHVGYPLACKVYPVSITENEMVFIRVLFSNDLMAARNGDGDSGFCRKVPYLVLPLAIATIDGIDRGVLMARQDYSLKQFLIASSPPPSERVTRIERKAVIDEGEGNSNTSLRSRVAFEPVRSCEVVTAIAFQLVFAVAALNEEIPHVVDGILCSGFTHNDIHLDNVLLNCSTGRVSLCDFELVSHISRHGEDLLPQSLHRIPPYCRQSPNGLFRPAADTWALGLLIISLLTGVNPLFNDDKLLDDFGDGPLLQSYSLSDGTTPVIDWEGNIKAHVERLLYRDDPKGARVKEAKPLMDLCSKCLVNRPGVKPSVAFELLDEPLFRDYIESPRSSECVVRSWMESRGAHT